MVKRSSLFLIVALLLSVWGVYYYSKPYYTPASKLDGLNFVNHKDDTIRVGFIGDSWVYGYRKIHCVVDSFINNATGNIVCVRTAGVSGLTSKNVYYSIFRNKEFRNVVEWKPNYCIVIAGINDSDRKMGKMYYHENMKLIIDLLLKNNITPVVLEIPSYDIKYSYERRNRKTKILYRVSMLLTWSKMDCIQDYRNSYWNLIRKMDWLDKVITICNTDWNPDGYRDKRDIYDEGRMHLNSKGYHVLDSCISYKIIERL